MKPPVFLRDLAPRRRRGLLLLPLLCAMLGGTASAASITLTAPAAPVTLPDGDDFATTVLGDPWDFAARRDVLFDQHLDGVTVTDGVWRGTARGDGPPALAPLFQGLVGSHTALHLDMPDFGTNRPVDASRYRELSWRIDSGTRRYTSIYWTRNLAMPLPCGPFGDGCNADAGSVLAHDADVLPGAIVPRSGWGIYDVRLDEPAQFADHAGVPWAGDITGLLLAPIDGDAGATLGFDWIRLVDPATSPTLDVTWTTVAAPGDATVHLYADASGGCAGDLVARQLANDGHHTLHTAMLPPGTWRFHVALVRPNGPGTALDVLATSGCSAPVTIARAPLLRFTSPSPTSGADYATEAIGNPWDMDGPDDVANIGDDDVQRGWTAPVFDAGIFRATALAPGRESPWSDASLVMPGPSAVPIETSRYRYLTFRLFNDTSRFTDTIDYQTRGGGLRAIFWDLSLQADGTDGLPALLFEGWHTYAIDLWTLPGDPTDTAVTNPGWLGLPLVSNLRVDPTEVQESSGFAFDDVALHAETCADDTLQVAWTLELGTGPATVDFWADADGADGGEIHLTGPVAAADGAGTATVQTAGLASGRWWIQARVDDGLHQRRTWARVPLLVPCPPSAAARELPAFVPQSGRWQQATAGTTWRGRQAGTRPAIATFPDVTGDGLRASAQLKGKKKNARVAAFFGFKDASHYGAVEIDVRRGRLTAFTAAGGKRKKVARVEFWRDGAIRYEAVPVVLRAEGGRVRLSIDGQVALDLSGLDTAGAVGFGMLRAGTLDVTGPRADALTP